MSGPSGARGDTPEARAARNRGAGDARNETSPSAAPIAAYYLALCGAMGLYLPYLSLYLSAAGLSDAAAVQVQTVVPFMSLLVPPLLGLLADARQARIWLLRGFSAASAVMFAL